MKVFWFDCETGGLSEWKNGIISLALKIEIEGEIRDSMSFRVKPFGEVDDRALSVNGFTRADLASFPAEYTMFEAILNLFKKHLDLSNPLDKFLPAGFNVDFDMNFLRACFKRFGAQLGRYMASVTVDPFKLYGIALRAGKVPLLENYKLTSVCGALGVELVGAHDAQADIDATIKCAEVLWDVMSGKAEIASGRS